MIFEYNDSFHYHLLLLLQFFGGLGNLTPNTFYIFAMIAPGGTDLPAYQELTSPLGIWICLANCYWFQPLAARACAMATLRSWGIVFAKYNLKNT